MINDGDIWMVIDAGFRPLAIKHGNDLRLASFILYQILDCFGEEHFIA